MYSAYTTEFMRPCLGSEYRISTLLTFAAHTSSPFHEIFTLGYEFSCKLQMATFCDNWSYKNLGIVVGQFFSSVCCQPFIYPPCIDGTRCLAYSATEIRFRCLSGRIPKLLMKFSTALSTLHFRTSFTHFLPAINISLAR